MMLKKLTSPNLAALLIFSVLAVPALPHVFHELSHRLSSAHSGDHGNHSGVSTHHHDDETHHIVPLNELPNACLKKANACGDVISLSLTAVVAFSTVFVLPLRYHTGHFDTGPPVPDLISTYSLSHLAHAPPLK